MIASDQISGAAPCSPLNILWVEDNEGDTKIGLKAFREQVPRNTIHIARNGEDALDFMYHRGNYPDSRKFPRPDLILLDISMPKMDGLEFLKILKQDSRFKHIPIVMFTTSVSQCDINDSFQNGAASYITKPVTYEAFTEKVAALSQYWHAITHLPKTLIWKPQI